MIHAHLSSAMQSMTPPRPAQLLISVSQNQSWQSFGNCKGHCLIPPWPPAQQFGPKLLSTGHEVPSQHNAVFAYSVGRKYGQYVRNCLVKMATPRDSSNSLSRMPRTLDSNWTTCPCDMSAAR